MQLTYIYQSSFILECEFVVFIFDYYKSKNLVHNELLNKINNTQKKIFVLVSHSHYDHFNKEIFNWSNKTGTITYILSDEVKSVKLNFSDLDIIFLEKYNTYKNNIYNVDIKAYGSTDIGCSFLINVDKKVIFHAGDLNNWHWNEEADLSQIKESEEYYLSELAIISKEFSLIDCLFFPIDRRLGKDYLKGIEQFIGAINVKLLVSMHFGNKYPKYIELQENLSKVDINLKIINIDKEGYSTKILEI